MYLKCTMAAISLLLLLSSCGNVPQKGKRTLATEKLYMNLRQSAERGIMFGSHDATLYGHSWYGTPDSCDVRRVSGSFPAVYGWEIGHLELGSDKSLDSVYFETMHQRIIEAFERGGVNTMSWHCDNPKTGGNTWDLSDSLTVRSILPGGANNAKYCQWLDKVADFISSLKTKDGVKVPILFRPYHEHTGSWFWWGAKHCTPEEYKALWVNTRKYMDAKGVDNVLYIYSPDVVADSAGYFERYPGDEYVDILGFDCYDRDMIDGVERYVSDMNNVLQIMTKEGKSRNKPIVLSETGLESLPQADWWTSKLLPTISQYPIVYVLVWRNAHNRPEHFYSPYPGQLSAADFVVFRQDKRTIFEDDLMQLYK